MTTAFPELGLDEAGPGTAITGFGRPFGLGCDADGRVYVADMDLHAVARLDPALTSVCWLGGDNWGWSETSPIAREKRHRAPRRAPGIFDGPHSVAIRPDGTLVIVTYYRPRILSWTPGYNPREIASINGAPLAGPATGTLDREGQLLVTEYGHHSVLLLDLALAFVGALGGGGRYGFNATAVHPAGNRAAEFDRPHMAVNLAGAGIWVADTWNNRIQRFDADGIWRGEIAAGINAPVAIGRLTPDRIVVTNWGDGTLLVFDLDGHLCRVEDRLGLDKPYDAQVFEGRLLIADSHNGRLLALRSEQT